MGHAATFRDCTQLTVPAGELRGLESALRTRFVISLRHEADSYRIVGAPSEIKRVAQYLLERGVAIA